MTEFFYNLRTGQVEEGRQSQGPDLMGPYATREEAQQALATAEKRNESWDAEDAAWEGDSQA
ncbi:SPOR domain-containing protein [Brachybacterium sp. EF45031]|uniref:SPOR domain-containing protein n=1 Tax=Brachybacterium sillae TaxID=2810536 RepID=UPI00217ED828|nr:SPOR domain-containing protein [Brachybacterium sillae]MCS6710726.1 SPOR domain-containing protein [Brachybacterium sillae]